MIMKYNAGISRFDVEFCFNRVSMIMKYNAGISRFDVEFCSNR